MDAEPMTERDEMVALAEMIEDSYQGNFVQDILLNEAERRQIVKALRSAARTAAGYGADQQRVSDYLQELSVGQVNGGRDPIGLLIAAHAGAMAKLAALPAPGGNASLPDWRQRNLEQIIKKLTIWRDEDHEDTTVLWRSDICTILDALKATITRKSQSEERS